MTILGTKKKREKKIWIKKKLAQELKKKVADNAAFQVSEIIKNVSFKEAVGGVLLTTKRLREKKYSWF